MSNSQLFKAKRGSLPVAHKDCVNASASLLMRLQRINIIIGVRAVYSIVREHQRDSKPTLYLFILLLLFLSFGKF